MVSLRSQKNASTLLKKSFPVTSKISPADSTEEAMSLSTVAHQKEINDSLPDDTIIVCPRITDSCSTGALHDSTSPLMRTSNSSQHVESDGAPRHLEASDSTVDKPSSSPSAVITTTNIGIDTQPAVITTTNIGIDTQPAMITTTNIGIDTQPAEVLNHIASTALSILSSHEDPQVQLDVGPELLGENSMTKANTTASTSASTPASTPQVVIPLEQGNNPSGFTPINIVEQGEVNSGDERNEVNVSDSGLINLVSDDEVTKKAQRKKRQNASKRSFDGFVKTDSLWMNSVLEDLDVLYSSLDDQIGKMKEMKVMLIESRNFIRACGAQEERITKRLKK